MKKQLLSLCLLASLISGCTEHTRPPVPLTEQLNGKTPEEQQEVLRLDCLNAAEKITGRTSMWHSGIHGGRAVYDPKIIQMKGLCHQMTKAYLIENQPQHARLKNECDAQLQALEVNPRTVEAIKKMRQICNVMTKN